MNQTSNQLSQEVAAMSDAFSDLGERALRAARELHAPGAPPPQELLDALSASRRDLESLRDRARGLAESLQVACPPAEELTSLQGLSALLDEVAEAEIRRSRSDEIRRRASYALGRVLSLAHASVGEYAPLHDCQNQARDLAARVAEAPWTDLPAEAERIADGDHPFAHLLTMIEDRDELHDDLWAQLHESVGAAFGKSMAAAVARSKLVLPAHPLNGHHEEPAATLAAAGASS